MISKSQLHHILALYRITPTKAKGQHFLLNEQVVDDAVDAAAVSSDDIIVEVGPGLGVLTEALLERAGRVIAIETDARLAAFLKAKFLPNQKLELVHGDALRFRPADFGLTRYKVVANIPYNITSPLLQMFMEALPRPVSLTLLVQKEVAERICAKPGEMSLLALSVQLYGQPCLLKTVRRGSFWPVPRVDSALLHIGEVADQEMLNKRLNGLNERLFWKIAKIGFSGKRKQLHNNLSAGLSREGGDPTLIKQVLAGLHLRPDIRAQALSVDDWTGLAKKLKNHLNLGVQTSG